MENFFFCAVYAAIFMNDLGNIPISFSTVNDNNLISLLLYGDDNFDV